MNLAIGMEKVPLETDAHGVVRVGGSRVPLDSVIAAFGAGATPEDIVQSYDSLSLADVYAVIAYSLRHQTEVDEYLSRSREERA
jgi:uncharacterized protein (DUF433 family)